MAAQDDRTFRLSLGPRRSGEAIETECSLSFTQFGKRQFVEDTSNIVEEVDGHFTPLGLGQCPVLLEHIDEIDPKVPALDWNDIRHRRWIMNLLEWLPH
jgi:hypothetical protein